MKTQPSPPQRRQTILLFLFLASYLLAYIVLSSHGSYIGHLESGSDNSAPRWTWYPEYCVETDAARTRVRLTPIGWLFLPPMLVDQQLIHRTRLNAK